MFLKSNNYRSNFIRNCSTIKFCQSLSDNWLNYQLRDGKNKNWIIFSNTNISLYDDNRKMVISRLLILLTRFELLRGKSHDNEESSIDFFN